MESAASISLLVYASLMALGGIMGFVKGKSKISLAAGLVSAVLLFLAYIWSLTEPKNAFLAGIGVTSVLGLVFAMRIAKTRKLMPAGALLILTIIEETFLLVAAFLKF